MRASATSRACLIAGNARERSRRRAANAPSMRLSAMGIVVARTHLGQVGDRCREQEWRTVRADGGRGDIGIAARRDAVTVIDDEQDRSGLVVHDVAHAGRDEQQAVGPQPPGPCADVHQHGPAVGPQHDVVVVDERRQGAGRDRWQADRRTGEQCVEHGRDGCRGRRSVDAVAGPPLTGVPIRCGVERCGERTDEAARRREADPLADPGDAVAGVEQPGGVEQPVARAPGTEGHAGLLGELLLHRPEPDAHAARPVTGAVGERRITTQCPGHVERAGRSRHREVVDVRRVERGRASRHVEPQVQTARVEIDGLDAGLGLEVEHQPVVEGRRNVDHGDVVGERGRRGDREEQRHGHAAGVRAHAVPHAGRDARGLAGHDPVHPVARSDPGRAGVDPHDEVGGRQRLLVDLAPPEGRGLRSGHHTA